MRSKLALWSWILTIMGVSSLWVFILSGGLYFLGVSPNGLMIFTLVGSSLLGLIFGVVVLIKIKRDPNLTGKTHAIFGIILNILLFFYGFFLLAMGLFSG